MSKTFRQINRTKPSNSGYPKYNLHSEFHLRGIAEQKSHFGRRSFGSGERYCPIVFLLLIFVPTSPHFNPPLLRSTETFQESFNGSTKDFLLFACYVGCGFRCSNYTKFVAYIFFLLSAGLSYSILYVKQQIKSLTWSSNF